MSLSSLLLPEYDTEIAITRRVLERTPDADGAGEWKPHEKAFPMAHLAQLVAMLPSWTTLVLKTTEFDVAPKEPRAGGGYSVQKTAALLEQFDKNAREGRAALEAATDADMDVPWTLKAGGNAVATESRYMTLRQTVLNHLVHHRAQLGLYLRIHGEKVPQMYGPTADEGWDGKPKA
jgi:uncharacterized damage-inducible protein DinB